MESGSMEAKYENQWAGQCIAEAARTKLRKEKQLHGSTTWCDFLRDKIAELTRDGLRTRHSSSLGEDFGWTLFGHSGRGAGRRENAWVGLT
jgi:hypothetical protein